MANTTGKKFGGRTKGTPNILTKELRLLLKDLLFVELAGLSERIESLEPKDRIEVMIKLLPFALPKVNNVHSKEDEPLDWGL